MNDLKNIPTNGDTQTETEDGCLYKYNAKQGMTFGNLLSTYTFNNLIKNKIWRNN